MDPTNWLQAGLVVNFLGTNGEAAVPALLRALQAADAQVASRAIQLLGAVHQEPDRCIPAISPFLAATNSRTRISAIEAISAFGSNSIASAEIPRLVRCLNDPDPSVQGAAKKALWQLRPNTPTDRLPH